MRQKLKNVLDTKVESRRSSVAVEGSYNRTLSDEEKEKITERLLAGVDAKVAEENQDKNLYTVYAYSPCFSESVSQGKKE